MTSSDALDEWRHTIKAGKLREFLIATGNTTDAERDFIPPTFLVTAAADFIPRLLTDLLKVDRRRTLHGEQTYEHFCPIRVGDELICTARLESDRISESRDGSKKRIVTVTIDYIRAADGVAACRETQTIIELGQ